jgi:hypothetical protein
LLGLAVWAVLKFRASRDAIQTAVQRDLSALRGTGIRVDQLAVVRDLEKALNQAPSRRTLIAVLLAAYAALELTEGVGRAAVAHLLLSKRLSGLRGGRWAYDSERRAEQLLKSSRARWRTPATASDFSTSPLRRILLAAEQPGQMRCVLRDRCIRGRGLCGGGRQILVVDGLHRLAVPVGSGLSGDAESDVVENLEQNGTDVVRSVLVPDDRGDGDLAERPQPALPVGLGQLGVQPFEYALAKTARLAHPGRGRQYQDVRSQKLPADGGPFVAVAHIGFDTGPDVVVGHSERAAADPVLGKFGQHLGREQVRARPSRGGFQRTGQGESGQLTIYHEELQT